MSTTKKDLTASVADAAETSLEAIKKSADTGMFTTKKFMVVLGLILTALVGFLAAWMIYNYIKTKTIDRKSYVVPETKNPVMGTVLTKGDGSGIPDALNGKRFTFSFWIYIHNLQKNAGQLKHVLHRGEENNSFGGSPAVFLDSTGNKLYIAFGSTTPTTDEPATLAQETPEVRIKYAAAKRGVTVDYVPIQRWVHISVVANENANGGSISAYVDGELVQTNATNRISTIKGTVSNNGQLINYRVSPTLANLALDRKGNVYIGGANDATAGMGFSGLVSLVEFHNYDLNSKDIYSIYEKGPLYLTTADKVANTIGMGALTSQYGVRNPIYKKPIINA